ncbi:ABC transporter substrate-binding protein [Streptomyces sp. NPDC007355]|uniref:ABC transporter substrate-binding protein n=1 Tax=Streptomyces sp. NPDC007355 TaxID=3364778 RepID=UPI003678941A
MHRSTSVKVRAAAAVAVGGLVCGLAACSSGASSPGGGDTGETLTVWSLENLTERVDVTKKIADDFTAKTGIKVKLVGVDENQLSQLVLSSAAAGKLPDVIGAVPLASVRQMASNELLDSTATQQVVAHLDPRTFNQQALELTRDGERQLAVPSDAWSQILVYRKDLFDKAGLKTPATYEDIEKAAKVLDGKGMDGISLATDPADAFTQQSFEDIAVANGCELVNRQGEVQLNSPSCKKAFSFYGDLATKYGAPGTQTVDSTRASYFAGKSSMIVWSSMLLDELAGLRNDAMPSCPECKGDPQWLAKNSGVVTSIKGPDGKAPAQFGEMTSWTITRNANKAASQQFVEFILDEGYADWFGMAPEGKVPVRKGTTAEPEKFQKAWDTSKVGVDTKKALSEIYSAQTIDDLRQGLDHMQRWGITQGQGELLGATIGELPVPKAISSLASGEADASEVAQQANDKVKDIQDSLK